MYSKEELSNKLSSSLLNKSYNNTVDIGYGLDANKIQKIDSFYSNNLVKLFHSNEPISIDSVLSNYKSDKYTVSLPKHTKPPHIQPFYCENNRPVTHHSKFKVDMEGFYGIPPVKNIVIKQPHDGITVAKLKIDNWRKETTATDNKEGFDNLPNGDVEAFLFQLDEHERLKKEKHNKPKNEKTRDTGDKVREFNKKKEKKEKKEVFETIKASKAFPVEEDITEDIKEDVTITP